MDTWVPLVCQGCGAVSWCQCNGATDPWPRRPPGPALRLGVSHLPPGVFGGGFPIKGEQWSQAASEPGPRSVPALTVPPWPRVLPLRSPALQSEGRQHLPCSASWQSSLRCCQRHELSCRHATDFHRQDALGRARIRSQLALPSPPIQGPVRPCRPLPKGPAHALEGCPLAMPGALPGQPRLSTVLGGLRTELPGQRLKPGSIRPGETPRIPRPQPSCPAPSCQWPAWSWLASPRCSL